MIVQCIFSSAFQSLIIYSLHSEVECSLIQSIPSSYLLAWSAVVVLSNLVFMLMEFKYNSLIYLNDTPTAPSAAAGKRNEKVVQEGPDSEPQVMLTNNGKDTQFHFVVTLTVSISCQLTGLCCTKLSRPSSLG